MRKLANLFLVLFLVAAILGLASELTRQFLAFPFPQIGVQLIWSACLLCGLGVYIGFGFNRHLPKRILLPLLIWLAWSLIDYWPLEMVVGEQYRLYAFVAQIIVGLIILHLNRLLNNRSFLLAPNQFYRPFFRFRNLLIFGLINIVVFPVILLLITFSAAGNLIESNSAGFVRLKPDGLYMADRTYRKKDKQIQLTGMIHLAQPEYYRALIASIPPDRTLILMEGVTDKKGLLSERFAYGNIADLLGLTSQDKMLFQGRLIDAATLNSSAQKQPPKVDLLPADIDLSDFDPLTIKVLNALAKYVLNADSPIAGYLEFSRWAQSHITADFNSIIMDDLLGKRDKYVVSYLPQALKKYDHLVIPWGALHMKGIEQSVIEKGFVLTTHQERLSIDFLLLPYGQIWERLTSVGK
jgi:hypothetical protein